MIGLSAIGVLLVILFGYWIAKAGLQPLKKMSDKAQTLSPKTLSERLAVSALPNELSDLAQAFNGALDRMENAYKQLEAFNADVAHELRTPLANLIGETQVALSRERSAPEFEWYCNRIWKNWTGCAPSSTTCCFWHVRIRAKPQPA